MVTQTRLVLTLRLSLNRMGMLARDSSRDWHMGMHLLLHRFGSVLYCKNLTNLRKLLIMVFAVWRRLIFSWVTCIWVTMVWTHLIYSQIHIAWMLAEIVATFVFLWLAIDNVIVLVRVLIEMISGLAFLNEGLGWRRIELVLESMIELIRIFSITKKIRLIYLRRKKFRLISKMEASFRILTYIMNFLTIWLLVILMNLLLHFDIAVESRRLQWKARILSKFERLWTEV